MEMNTALPPALDDIISRLISGVQIERIYLFGSQAAGKAQHDSDIDLLVVVPPTDQSRHQLETQCYNALWGLKTPVDVIVYTKSQFERMSKTRTSLAVTALNKGIVLYERPQAG
jgi:predicted nucleotidyltransferase